MARQYLVRLEMQMEGPDDLYEAHDHFTRMAMESIMPLAIVDVQQIPRQDQTQDRPNPDEQQVANIKSVNLDDQVYELIDGAVYVDGDYVGEYGDVSELDRNKVDEAMGEQRQLEGGV